MQIPHIKAGFSSLACHALYRIAFPVVSEAGGWCISEPLASEFSKTVTSGWFCTGDSSW